jgi:hypothetical protein
MRLFNLPRPLFFAACFAFTIAFFACACSSKGEAPSANSGPDPRCTSLCTIQQPPVANAGDVCSQTSADKCLQECAARIEGKTAVCGDCLLQNAQFGNTTGGSGPGSDCNSLSTNCPGASECTMIGPGGTCTYCANDSAAEQNCYVQTNPRREVECPTDFRDPAVCSALCAVK